MHLIRTRGRGERRAGKVGRGHSGRGVASGNKAPHRVSGTIEALDRECTTQRILCRENNKGALDSKENNHKKLNKRGNVTIVLYLPLGSLALL
jgi:hypothetical protein